MGAWGTEILANDQSRDVYRHYMKLHSQGLNPAVIKKKLFRHETTANEPAIYDNTLFWFGLAQAQLETNNIDLQVLEVIEKIIRENIDEDYWTLEPGLYEERKKNQEYLFEKLKAKLDSKKINSMSISIQLGHSKIQIPAYHQNIRAINDIFPLLFVHAEESIYIFWKDIPIRLRYREDLYTGFNELLSMVWMVQKEINGSTKVNFTNQLLFIYWELRWNENNIHITAKYSEREDVYQLYANALNQTNDIKMSKKTFLREWNTLLYQVVVTIKEAKVEVVEGTERRKWELLQLVVKNINGFGILYTRDDAK